MSYFDFGPSIFNLLNNDSNVTDKLGSWQDPITLQTYYALFEDRSIPHDRKETPVINYYRVDIIDGGSEIDQSNWSINCRSDSYMEAEDLARAVYDSLNRNLSQYLGNTFFFVVSILATLPPQDETDIYNTPVEAIIKARNN